MKRTAFTVVGVLAVSFIVTARLGWPSEDWALVMMAVDAVAATIILFHPAGKAQALVGLTFLLQIGVHAGRVLNGDRADIDLYWLGLTILAFLQLLVLGFWWLYERIHWGGHVRGGGTVAHPAYREGVD